VQTTSCAVDVSLAGAAGLAPGHPLRLRIDPDRVRFVPVH
jgi:molybdate transport system ATP-binding protein